MDGVKITAVIFLVHIMCKTLWGYLVQIMSKLLLGSFSTD